MNGLSIIIPSKSAHNLPPCVRAVRDAGEMARIIVVDDGVDFDAAKANWPASAPPITFLSGVKPFVFARNINIGIRAAAAGDVVLLNDDAMLKTPHGFTGMQRVSAAHPEYGLIAATCNNVGNRSQWPRARTGVRDEPRMVCFVCVFIPQGTIEKVGLLDERFVGYGCDDDDYCLRVRKAGLTIGIFDGCFVDHSTLKSTYRGRVLAADYQPNLKLFAEKWGALEGAQVGTF